MDSGKDEVSEVDQISQFLANTPSDIDFADLEDEQSFFNGPVVAAAAALTLAIGGALWYRKK